MLSEFHPLDRSMEASRISSILHFCAPNRSRSLLSGHSMSFSFSSSAPVSGFPLRLKLRQDSTQKRSFCFASGSQKMDELTCSSKQTAGSFFRSVLSSMEKDYLSRNPTAKAILDLVRVHDGDHICYDHFAFRTFGIDGHGIDSMANFFREFGYTQRDELRFPAKKLKALWFSPPDILQSGNGTGIDGPLPRIFISELLVDEMSSKAQEIIRKYTKVSGDASKHAALASALGCLTWEKPSYSDYQELSRESEYAAWTLVNGYALNHATISTHRLRSAIRDIHSLNKFIEDSGFKLNSEGGVLKVSPDGLLLQSSTVADSTAFHFADGTIETVPCCYIEFAERLVLAPYKSLPEEEIKEFHRRDGFEVGNADKIFESTSKDQLSMKG
ncbi:2-oxoadipate dioxygenase/decarboxylase, chloroplastic/amyloplastic [Aristolochia californica]|uniref:2-oxoadipate dioxygenase/decarboxylase, chloroplastic/amyloplastic n=1 Tax=Aristolochia californica TaxID=171875 RepID=UPI0035DEF0FD